MKKFLYTLMVFLTGCSSIGMQDYGNIYPIGKVLTTSCVSIISFNKRLRASPQIYGDDTFVGYIDYGQHMPKGHVFLVLPLKTQPNTVGELLIDADPRHRQFWLEAQLLRGEISSNTVFEARVPPIQKRTSPNAVIAEREALFLRGEIHVSCGNRYLVAVQANPLVSESNEWEGIRESYANFKSSLRWPE